MLSAAAFLGVRSEGEPAYRDQTKREFNNGTVDGQAASGWHECDRECVAGDQPKECYYKFEVELYSTLNKVKYNLIKRINSRIKINGSL